MRRPPPPPMASTVPAARATSASRASVPLTCVSNDRPHLGRRSQGAPRKGPVRARSLREQGTAGHAPQRRGPHRGRPQAAAVAEHLRRRRAGPGELGRHPRVRGQRLPELDQQAAGRTTGPGGPGAVEQGVRAGPAGRQVSRLLRDHRARHRHRQLRQAARRVCAAPGVRQRRRLHQQGHADAGGVPGPGAPAQHRPGHRRGAPQRGGGHRDRPLGDEGLRRARPGGPEHRSRRAAPQPLRGHRGGRRGLLRLRAEARR